MNTIIISNRLTRIALIVLLGLMTLQTGCKKEEEKDTLNGTIWKYTEIDGNYRYEETILFQERTFTDTMVETYGTESDTDTSYGTYEYNPPTVTFHIVEGGITTTITGKISGNQLTIYGVEDVWVFIKQ